MIWIIFVFIVIVFVNFRFKSKYQDYKFPPGPISLPIFGSVFSLGTKPNEKLSQLKNKYGNVVAFNIGSRRGIVLNDTDVIKHALSRKEFQCRPDMESGFILRGKDLSGIVLSSGKSNEEQRTFVLKTLKNFGMGKKSIEILFVEELKRLFEMLDQKLGIPIVNNNELFQLTAVSALWTIMTGEQGKADDSEFLEMLNEVRKLVLNSNIFTFYMPTLSKLFPNLSGWNGLISSGKNIYKYVGKTLQAHQQVYHYNDEPHDLVEAYLQKIDNTQDEKSTFFGKIGEENLRCVLADFLAAGSETVSTSLAWYLAVTIYFPDVQEKIQSEIDREVGLNRLPSLKDRQQLPYVEAVVLEIIRFSAVSPLGLPHATSENVELEGYLIPKGTIVMQNIHGALHDPRRWDQPDTFNPMRFLDKDGYSIERNVARNVDLAFGHGKRICPGETLAKDELFLFITGLSQRYHFERDPRHKYGLEIVSQLGLTLVPRSHPIIINKR